MFDLISSNLETVIIGVIFGTLLTVMLVTLIPNREKQGLYQRQRKFLRVEGLQMDVLLQVLAPLESQTFLKQHRLGSSRLTRAESPVLVKLRSLAIGGCSVTAPFLLEKGQVFVLHVSSLPHFPAANERIAAKVIWIRREGEEFLYGCKFVESSSNRTIENVKKYVNYLLDEPAV